MIKSLENISSDMIKRYSNRYNKLGYNVKTLGWGNKEQQYQRFDDLLDIELPLNNKTLLDIGCGFGDFYIYLKNKNVNFKHYTGIDINPDLINETKNMGINNQKDCSFGVHNILKGGIDIKVNTAFLIGVLNLNLKNEVDNYKYSQKIIRNAFECVTDNLVVNLLDDNLTPDYPKEDFIFYHNDIKMIEFANTLTKKVEIKYSPKPIPQKEFNLILYK